MTNNVRSLKILHLGKYFHPDSGGIERVTKSIVQGTAGAGCAVTVLCFDKVSALQKERWDRVDVIRAPIWKVIASQPLGWQYFRHFFRHARDFDIVHVHVPNMLAALAILVAPGRGKIVLHWHADIVDKGWIGRVMRPLEHLMLRRADAVVATSQAYADASPQLGKFKRKVHVVPIGIVDPQSKIGSPIKSPLGAVDVPEAVPVILAVGRLVPYKGFDVLISAARHLTDDCRIVIVGDGAQRGELEGLIQEIGVADRVILLGGVSDDELQLLLQRAAIFCLPSVTRAEAFGVVLLEAMAYGLPIVATEISGSGVPWVNCHGVSGLNVRSGDAVALAGALTQLLASPQRRVQLGQAARVRYETKFTAEAATHSVMNLYCALTTARTGEEII